MLVDEIGNGLRIGFETPMIRRDCGVLLRQIWRYPGFRMRNGCERCRCRTILVVHTIILRRTIRNYARSPQSVFGAVLLAHERVLRRGRILLGARAQVAGGNGGRRRQGGLQVRQAGRRQRERLPVRLPAGHHAGVAGPGLVGRTGGFRAHPSGACCLGAA